MYLQQRDAHHKPICILKKLSRHPTHAWHASKTIATCMEWLLVRIQQTTSYCHACMVMNAGIGTFKATCMHEHKNCTSASWFLTIAHWLPSTSKRVLTLHPNWPWIRAPTLVRHTCTSYACKNPLIKATCHIGKPMRLKLHPSWLQQAKGQSSGPTIAWSEIVHACHVAHIVSKFAQVHMHDWNQETLACHVFRCIIL